MNLPNKQINIKNNINNLINSTEKSDFIKNKQKKTHSRKRSRSSESRKKKSQKKT